MPAGASEEKPEAEKRRGNESRGRWGRKRPENTTGNEGKHKKWTVTSSKAATRKGHLP